jgi:hypothetical protein
MKFPDINHYKTVILLAVVVLATAGTLFFSGVIFHPEEIREPPQQDIQPVLQPSPTRSSNPELPHYDYCIIQEAHPDYLRRIPQFIDPNATIVQLSSVDLEPFPEYRELMTNESKLSKKWRDGYRFIGDFHDYQRQSSDFRKLTCKHSNDPACDPRQPALYEVGGRYFTVRCYPDFGREAPSPPPSPTPMYP